MDRVATMKSELKKYRLLTRSDFDGLVCGILLKDRGILDSIKFVHPKDVQDGKIEVTENDILTNLPYMPECHLCFDHHSSERLRVGLSPSNNHVLESDARSAARVVYNYYGGHSSFPAISEEMLNAVDKSDSASFTRQEILHPQGWVLLSFLMDPRTGLGRFRDFRISNYELMMQLIDHCRNHRVEETLALPDVRERVDIYQQHEHSFTDQILRCTTIHDNIAVLDLRNEKTLYAGNRFMIYALFPACELSIHVLWGLNRQNTVIAVGKSILNRTSHVKIGDLLLTYGGGGHDGAGTCQVSNDAADEVVKEILYILGIGTQREKQPELQPVTR